jgi:hypothetical protein
MNICGFHIDAATQAAIFGFALTLASEAIGMSKLRENSLIQLGLKLLTNHAHVATANHQKESPVSTSQPAPKTRSRSSKPSSRTSRAKASE